MKKEMKVMKKNVEKSKNKGNKKPSGFAKPTKVTDELCVFMNFFEISNTQEAILKHR